MNKYASFLGNWSWEYAQPLPADVLEWIGDK